MTDNIYSFGETETLLETLSGASSIPTLSPFEMNNSSSTKSSYYSDSPNENNFLQDDWNKFDDTEFGLASNDDGFLSNNESNAFVSPSSTAEGISPPYLNIVKQEFSPIKEEEIEDFGDLSSSNSDKEDHDPSKVKTSVPSKNKVTKPKKDRSSHTVIEKKYRTNINTKITALRDAVPSLRVASGAKDINIDDLDGLTPPSKVNKATIFTKATEYIKHLENKNDTLSKENQQLKRLLTSYASHSQSPRFSFNQHQPSPQQQQTPQQTPTHQSQQQQTLSQFQPATDLNGNPLNIVGQAQPNYQIGLPGKMLMGGLTVMAGQSMFNGNNNFDQYGLSAFPILSSPTFSIFVTLIKLMICFSSLVLIFVPNLFVSSNVGSDEKSNKKIQHSEWYELIKQLIFIHTGDLNKIEISEADANKLINEVLLNEKNESITFFNHIFLLLKLHTFKSNFEISFGKIILSKLILSYSHFFQRMFLVNLKINDIINENIAEISKNQKIQEQNLRYFFKEINNKNSNSSLQNSEIFKRLLNLSLGLKLDLNCNKGVNDKGYEMILKDEQVIHDYKSLLISLRANELFVDVLLEYINLTFNDKFVRDLSNDELKELKTEIWNKLTYCEQLSPKNSVIGIRIELFKSICNEKYLNSVLKLINDETEEVKLDQEVVEYSDFEDDDEEEHQEEVEDEDESQLPKSSRQVSPHLKKILSQDLFNSLVCATILKSINFKKEDEVSKLLKHLKFNKNEISILSFISMFKIVEKFPKEWIQEESVESGESFQQILNQVTIYLRLWIGDSNNVNCKDLEDEGIELKREISDKLVEVSKKFNEL